MTNTTATIGCDYCARSPGFVEVEIDGVVRMQRCECWRKRYAFAEGVPVEFRDVRLSNWRETAETATALKVAKKFLETDSPLDLFFYGSVGSGKTRLACTLLNENFQRSRAGLFMRVPRMLLKLQPSSRDDERVDLFQKCEVARLLVLDDIGAERERATDYTRRTLLTLYESRSDQGLSTIWTSNKTPAEIGEFMQDDRLMSRLVGRCDVIAMNGPDWRLGRQ